MTASKIFLYFCLSFIGGIFLDSTIFTPQLGFSSSSKVYLLLVGLILGILLISVPPSLHLRKRAGLAVIGFCILFLVLGIWRHQEAEIQISKSKLQNYQNTEETINLIGIVGEEPAIGEKSTKLTIKTEEILTENSSLQISEKVLVTVNRYPEYKYGDKVKITGKLESPPVFEGFNYRDFLKKDGVYSVMSWPKTELVGEGFGNSLMRTIFSFKNKFQETCRTFISSPQEGILEALIFGDEAEISKEWKDKLNLTGTRHITAVSGMNITIIGFLILSFALSIGLWRQQAFCLSIFLLLLYILMIGAPASAVRAGIMAGTLMTAQYFGRLSAAGRAVIFAAFFMLLLNPLLLRLDVGFQLSFLAILGIIYLQPTFSDRFFKKIPNPKIFPLKTTLASTIAAQTFTLPILLYNFGYVSLLSPAANLLIVPVLAPITILIFIFGFAGMILWPLGFIFSLPTWFFLTYIVSVVDWFSKLSFVSLALENVHWVWLIISYLILGVITWRFQENQKLKFLNY